MSRRAGMHVLFCFSSSDAALMLPFSCLSDFDAVLLFSFRAFCSLLAGSTSVAVLPFRAPSEHKTDLTASSFSWRARRHSHIAHLDLVAACAILALPLLKPAPTLLDMLDDSLLAVACVSAVADSRRSPPSSHSGLDSKAGSTRRLPCRLLWQSLVLLQVSRPKAFGHLSLPCSSSFVFGFGESLPSRPWSRQVSVMPCRLAHRLGFC